MKHENVPQWMKEVLERGYKPARIHNDLGDSLFGYIDANTNNLIRVLTKRLYVLEGLPGAGKTSTVELLSSADDSLEAIPQILPEEPTFDQDMSQDFFMRSDQLKTQRFVGSGSSVCLSDRYYASTLAFSWAYDKMHGTKTHSKALKWYKLARKQGKLVSPYAVFYINVPVDVSLVRKGRVASKRTEDLWLNTDFLKYFGKYYDYFYRKVEPQTRLIKISGLKALEDIQAEIKKRIDREG